MSVLKIKVNNEWVDIPSIKGEAGTTNYNELENKPSINNVTLGGNKTLSELGITNFSGSYNDLTNKPTLFDGNYNSLTNKPTIPSKTSQLTNDSNFLTEHQDISGKQDKTSLETDVKAFINKTYVEGLNIVTNYSISNRTESTYSINPNTFYVWGEMASLNVTLATPTNTNIVNEYCFQFTSGSAATELTVPNTVKWVQTPTIETNKTYQVSIINNIGVIIGA